MFIRTLISLLLFAVAAAAQIPMTPGLPRGITNNNMVATNLAPMTTSTQWMAFSNYGQECRIKSVVYEFGVINTSQSVDITIQDPAADGRPDGTADATCTDATPATGVSECTFGTSVLKGLGARYFVHFDFTSTDGDIDFKTISTTNFALGNNYEFSGNGSANTTVNMTHLILLGCDDDNNATVDRYVGASPIDQGRYGLGAVGNAVYKSDDAVDELGVILNYTANQEAIGICFQGEFANNATFEVDVSALSTGTSLCAGADGCADTTMLDEDMRGNTVVARHGCLPFDEVVSLTAGTDYVASIRAMDTTASAVEINYQVLGTALYTTALYNSGGASRANEGSWTSGASACGFGDNCEDISPMIQLMVQEVAPAGGGGGMVGYGSVR